VEEGDDSTLVFGSLFGFNAHEGEGAPEDNLANVGGNEKVNGSAEAVALLEEFVKEEHNNASHRKLNNNEDWVDETKVGHLAIHAGEEVGKSLANSNNNAK
jgi:hypothetical protein